MSEAIITVEGLGKRYRLGASRSNERYTALRDVIATKAAAPFRALKVKLERRKEKTNGELIAALRPPPSDSELSPCNLPTFKPSHSTPEDFWALKNVSFEVKQGEVGGGNQRRSRRRKQKAWRRVNPAAPDRPNSSGGT